MRTLQGSDTQPAVKSPGLSLMVTMASVLKSEVLFELTTCQTGSHWPLSDRLLNGTLHIVSERSNYDPLVTAKVFIMEDNSQYSAYCAACGRAFYTPGAMSNHRRTCKKTKARLSSALARARDVFLPAKRLKSSAGNNEMAVTPAPPPESSSVRSFLFWDFSCIF